jgi:hypothetical protein
MNPKEDQVKSEFDAFVRDPGLNPPAGVSARVKMKIEESLQPALSTAVTQVFGLHAVSASVTLLVCPQFGIGSFGGGKGLMGFVEAYGHVVCGLFCGAFFMSLTAVLAPFWLSSPVRRVLSRNPLALAGLMSLSSLSGLLLLALMVRGEVPHLHLEFLLPWFGAAVLSAYAGIYTKPKTAGAIHPPKSIR